MKASEMKIKQSRPRLSTFDFSVSYVAFRLFVFDLENIDGKRIRGEGDGRPPGLHAQESGELRGGDRFPGRLGPGGRSEVQGQ